MTIESALTFFIAIFIFGVTPGPGVFAILARALASGASACFFLALGMVVSDIAYLVLACYGLAAVAERWGEAFMVVRIAGALYLLYLGWKMWAAPVDTDLEAAGGAGGGGLSFVQGFLISASNPKVILFYIAFLPTFIDLGSLAPGDITLAAVLTLVGLMAGLMLIACGASSARRFFGSKPAMKRLNRVAGSIMAGAGFYVAGRG